MVADTRGLNPVRLLLLVRLGLHRLGHRHDTRDVPHVRGRIVDLGVKRALLKPDANTGHNRTVTSKSEDTIAHRN